MTDENKEQKGKLPFFRMIFFITLLTFVIYIGQIIEKNYKTEKVLGAETKNSGGVKILDEINDKIKGIFAQSVKTAEKSVDGVIDEAMQYATETASKSAEAVKDSIFQSTVGIIIKQIDKLPNKQKEEIKNQVCK